ncbi:lipoprotein NlpI [Photobacterium chitinilyticum]|uniref:Lipoprotein NlpI n=1 Tax=Photobacterium chitinilyticum TaxID=2485123 RepID=A0A3S3RZF5_9GAMM|nr:lipoprotein NlpI [Photobacterium chitinilyticum]RWX54142.1 lipoprotein NlpI [Photobacterium chitinilyticum]
MIANRLTIACVAMIIMLAGCTAAPQSNWTHPPMAVPFQPTIQQQIQLARIDQLLKRNDLNDDTLAQVYYERGLLHDSIGLRDLARLDFNQSLSLKPDQPDVFNILGVYFTQSAHFDAAYEAFDSTLELNLRHPFAQRNRGIALYYGGRYELALEDLIAHYQQNVNDPYRVIWLYLVDLEKEPETAKDKLQRRYDVSDKQDWGWQVVRLYLGEITESEFLGQITTESEDNDMLAQRLTEAYFYMGKLYHYNKDFQSALMLYKLALAGNVYEFVEHRFSLLELSRLMAEANIEQPTATAGDS